MHHCLQITEILHHIIGFLVDDFASGLYNKCVVGHKDVARVARTCKAFKDPALDALWRTQSSLSPLVMCLPGHLWTIEVVWNVGVLSLLQEPSHEDWLSLKKYSRRIQAFDRTGLLLPFVNKGNLKAIFSQDLFYELFPSLHTLHLRVLNIPPGIDADGVDSLSLLAPLHLSHLIQLSFEIHPPLHSDSVETLYFVPASAPSLRVLRISAERLSSAILGVGFREMPNLRRFDLSRNVEVLPSSMRELIHLEYLRDLTVTLPDDFDVDVGPSTQPVLPSLQYLEVHTGSLSQFTKFLSSITSSNLRSISVAQRRPTPQGDIHTLYQLIQACFPDIHTLCIESSCSTVIDPSFNISQSMITALFGCRGLRFLSLDSVGLMEIDNTFIAQVALAWPNIEALRLHGRQRSEPHSVTLEGIYELLRCCPRLRSLALQIDARILPEQEPEMQSLSLRTIEIFTPPLEDDSAVQQYITMLAPNLGWCLVENEWFSVD